jgi:uncharacterized membrane protein YeaQ/YmgE (transglycosylase-associated protein family)
MNKIKRSGKLLKAAFAVLLREKKLLLFPFVATGLAAVVAVFFMTPILFYPTGHSIFSAEHWSALFAKAGSWLNVAPGQHSHAQYKGTSMLAGHPVAAAFFVVAYFISMFLATFSNVAFYHEIMRALNGDAVSIRRGYRFAAARWRAVLLWSLFAGLVGYLIQAIQERLGFFGRIVTGLIGFAWSTACIFIIPTLVRDTETTNPFKLLQNSVGTLRRTWGETIVGFVGIGILSALAMATVVLGVILALAYPMIALSAPILPTTGAHPHHLWILPACIVVVAVIVGTVLSYLGGIINSIYRCSLYLYATEGVVPGSFDKELLDSAWKVK